MINIYLDDLRPEPDGFVLAKNVEECIKLFSENKVNIISLDHDLGEELTGYDFVKWMITGYVYGELDLPKTIILHTANPVGRENMAQMIERYKPSDVKLHQFPLYFGNCYNTWSD